MPILLAWSALLLVPWVWAALHVAVPLEASMWRRRLAASGMLTIAIVPAVVLQSIGLALGMYRVTFSFSDWCSGLGIQMWALAGGAVVQWPFDRWVKDLTGHRQATMLDNWWVYALATVVWLIPWVVWVARGFDDGSSPWRSRRARIAVGVVAVNALLGTGFPWWGS